MFRSHFKWNYKLLIRSFNKAVDYFPRFTRQELPETHFSKLNNDIKIISENWDSQTCTVGLWMDIGSRCENDNNNGIAHFLEHMYFKGTKNRNHKTIQSETIERGAIWNTCTSREIISISCSCQNSDLEWAVSLLGEIVSMPKYEDGAIEKSKECVLNEMETIEKNYQEVVFDYLHATAYQGTPLSRSILGTEEVIKNITSKDLYSFINSYYKAPKMVLAAVGDVDHENLNSIANKYLGEISCNYENGVDQRLPCRFTGSDLRDRDDALPLGHVTIAFQGPGWSHADSIPLLIASVMNGSYDRSYGGTVYTSNILAVAAFNNGNVHSFKNFFMSYHDTSLWGFYYTSTVMEMQKATEYFVQQMMRLCANISEFEVNRAKTQLKSRLMSINGSNAICNELGQHVITYGRRIPVDEMLARIDLIHAADIRAVCQKYIYDKCPAVAGYGPIEGLPDYNNIRSRTYWMRY